MPKLLTASPEDYQTPIVVSLIEDSEAQEVDIVVSPVGGGASYVIASLGEDGVLRLNPEPGLADLGFEVAEAGHVKVGVKK